MAKYFGFAIADSMFPSECSINKTSASEKDVEGATPCLNPSHKATIDAMKDRFGIEINIPATPPQVKLAAGDVCIVMSVRGLPRLTDRHEYTEEEIENAKFTFSKYEITSSVEDMPF